MATFKVKASYEYTSPHEDDLSFPAGQIITVTEEEGDDWYVGEYTDGSGGKHEGLFPRNFVEKYEPEPPPRPSRTSKNKPSEQPVVQAAPQTPEIPQHETFAAQRELSEPQQPSVEIPAVAAKPEPTTASPQSAHSSKAAELAQDPAPESAAPSTKKAPPPIAVKSNAFRDRIAAFNAPAAAPIQPFRPGGGPPSTFVKKPFVAPPPSRNAYVPPPREQPQVKSYRRDEDPEVAERQAQDHDNAERAGLVGHGSTAAHDGEEADQPKVSLKERIALLQKQQQEQAARAAGLQKDKPKRPPPKKRTESQEAKLDEDGEQRLEKVASVESRERGSIDQSRPPRSSHGVVPSEHVNRELLSDANDADQSGAGDTEDAEGTSTSVDDDDKPSAPHRAAAAPSHEADVGDEQDAEEEEEDEEEDEMTAEERRKLELRQRMAKMSGGMGMAGMFGGIPAAGLPPKKKKAAEKKPHEDDEELATPPQQRVPMFGMPGMAPMKIAGAEDRELAVETEPENTSTIGGLRAAEEVPDVEDVADATVQRTPTSEKPPPVPAERRPIPPPVPTSERSVPPPIPSASRPPPIRSPSPGSESGDELTDAPAPELMASPRTPSAVLPVKRTSFPATDEPSHDLSGRRGIPPMPPAFPATTPQTSRPPPPPPPAVAPPTRSQTTDTTSRKIDREGETDYEGDYDTDIASGDTHKDALKAHARDSAADDETMTEHTAIRSPKTAAGPPPLPPIGPRGVPPLPPQQPPGRISTDAPRAVPPQLQAPVPTQHVQDEDDDYDPYRYTSPNRAIPPSPRNMPPTPQAQPPRPQARQPPPGIPPLPPVAPPLSQQVDSSDEDDMYTSPPPRKSHDRPPPPPPQAAHQQRAPPPPQDRPAPLPPSQERGAPPLPPPQERAAPPPPSSEASHTATNVGGRKSLDANRAVQGRASTDQPRPSVGQDFIATDLDLGAATHWWTQPSMLPPSLQNRKDVLIEMDESRSGDVVEKFIAILYVDYSQTVITAVFPANDVSKVTLNQRHDTPPAKLRQDQLENVHEQYGLRIAKDVESKANTVVGGGSPQDLVLELLRPYNDALRPVSTRSFGALIYANLANASTQQYDEIRPGDIISFRNAKFQGKHGAMHAKYSQDVGKPDHVGVVVEWDGSKKKVRVWEQGRESKKVKPESFRMGDLRSGEVRVWRVMGRNWVGWS